MPNWVGAWGITVLGGLSFVPLALFLRTMQRSLEKCSRRSRALGPGLVWLGLIPVFGLVWQFVLVVAVGRSLGDEYRARGMAVSGRPAQSLGLVFASVLCLAVVVFYLALWGSFLLGLGGAEAASGTSSGSLSIVSAILFLVGIVLWVIYWISIHRYTSRLPE